MVKKQHIVAGKNGFKPVLAILFVSMMFTIPLISALELSPIADSKTFKSEPTEDMSNWIKEDFNAKYGVIELRSNFMWIDTGKVAEYSLTKNTELCMINCEAEGKVTLYQDGTIFDDIKFKTLVGEDTSVISYEYQLFEGYKDNYIDVPQYKEVCTTDLKNSSKSCNNEIIGYDRVNQPIEIWNNYNSEELKAGDYRWKIKGIKGQGQSVDFIPIRQDKEFSEWAVWNSSFNTGLTAYWKLNESSGNSVDSLGINNLTNYGATFTTGKIGNAGNFSGGTTTYFNTTTPIGDFGTNNFTISFWIKHVSDGTQRVIMINDNAWIGATNWAMSKRVSHKFFWNTCGTEGTITIDDGNWHNIVVVRTGTGANLLNVYIDNSTDKTCTDALNYGGGKGVFIAKGMASAVTAGVLGQIDEIGIWNRSLTTSEITDLYNAGAGITYLPTISGYPVSIITTLISPANNTNSSIASITFSANATATNGNVTNMTLYIWNGGTTTNSTTGLSNNFNSSSWNISGLSEGSKIWNVLSCATNSTTTLCAWDVNRTFTIDSIAPNITILSPTGIVNYAYLGQNISLNYSITDNNIGSCWYNYNGTNRTIPCSANSSFILTTQKNLTMYANDTFGNVNSQFISWDYSILENSRINKPTAIQTGREVYTINLTANSSLTNVNLILNGTSYAATQSGELWTSNITIPSTLSGNKTINWSFVYGGNTINSNLYSSQVINPLIFSVCNTTNNIPFVNYTFQDEFSLVMINETFNGQFSYLIDSASIAKTYTYINTSEKPSYAFCVSPASPTIILNPSIQYSATDYPTRTYNTQQTLNNITTNTTLLSLNSLNGIYVTFQVAKSVGGVVQGALINIKRVSDNVVLGEQTTDGAGITTFFLNPNIPITVTVTATGYDIGIISITPTQSSYTITLSSSGGTLSNSTIPNYYILPSTSYLDNKTSYHFNFTIDTNPSIITFWGMNITNQTTVLYSITSATDGGTLDTILNTGNNTYLNVIGYWTTAGINYSFNKAYSILDQSGGEYSLWNFFTNLSNYFNDTTDSDGLFGLKKGFGLNIVIFLIIFIITGVMSWKFGLYSQTAIVGMATFLVILFDSVLGLVATPVPNVPSFLSAIILVIVILRENS